MYAIKDFIVSSGRIGMYAVIVVAIWVVVSIERPSLFHLLPSSHLYHNDEPKAHWFIGSGIGVEEMVAEGVVSYRFGLFNTIAVSREMVIV
jgi:hypothetical protein